MPLTHFISHCAQRCARRGGASAVRDNDDRYLRYCACTHTHARTRTRRRISRKWWAPVASHPHIEDWKRWREMRARREICRIPHPPPPSLSRHPHDAFALTCASPRAFPAHTAVATSGTSNKEVQTAESPRRMHCHCKTHEPNPWPPRPWCHPSSPLPPSPHLPPSPRLPPSLPRPTSPPLPLPPLP